MNKERFSSKIGIIMATAASAVGLGNIWKFPYMTGQNGGGAFLLIYIICVLIFGIPIMLCEFSIGQNAHSGIHMAFNKLSNSNNWRWTSSLFLVTSLCMLSFYLVVTGWCLDYLVQACTNSFQNATLESLLETFDDCATGSLRPIIYIVIVTFITAVIVVRGIQKGIEQVSKFIMPVLLILLAIMAARGIMMDTKFEGLAFLFKPDFSQVNAITVLNAMGQCFFSLSIGMGVLITYGAYANQNTNPVSTSISVVAIDTLVAVLAGLAIFPAVFALGINPKEGPQLVFVTLPLVFQEMNCANLTSIIFFTLLFITAITSTISLLEIQVSYTIEKYKLKRRSAILIWSLIAIGFASLCSLSLSKQLGQTLSFDGYPIFEYFDFIGSRVLLPLGSIIICIFVGWFMPRDTTAHLLKEKGHVPNWLNHIFFFLVKFILPIFILLIFLHGLGLFAATEL